MRSSLLLRCSLSQPLAPQLFIRPAAIYSDLVRVVGIHQTRVAHDVVPACHLVSVWLGASDSGTFTVGLKRLAHALSMSTLIARQVSLVARLIKRRLADVGISVNA